MRRAPPRQPTAGTPVSAGELIDLIGHDTNFAVTQSVYEANFGDKRYVPSLLQREMVDGGLLGRKSGRGFYDHRERAVNAEPVFDGDVGRAPAAKKLAMHGHAVERRQPVGAPHRMGPHGSSVACAGNRGWPTAPDSDRSGRR